MTTNTIGAKCIYFTMLKQILDCSAHTTQGKWKDPVNLGLLCDVLFCDFRPKNLLFFMPKLFSFHSLPECRDKTSKLPMMLPKPEDFAAYVHKLAGIENRHHVIIYDNSERFGLFSAPRCWYLFRVMGHEFVHIVDGGLPKWVKDGFETASGEYSKAEDLPGTGRYTYMFNYSLLNGSYFCVKN